MFLKQTAYKPRSGSQSSGSDQAAGSNQSSNTTAAVASSPPNDPAKSGIAAAAAAGRRRSSTDQKFAGLAGYKRGSQDNQAKWAEQKPGSQGVLGQMWTSFTKGS